MHKFGLLLLFGCRLLVPASPSPTVEGAYRAVADVVSPGQVGLTEESLRALFNTLEDRVQCGDVPCEKVGFDRLRPDVGVRGRGPTRRRCLIKTLSQFDAMDNAKKKKLNGMFFVFF